MLARNAGLSYAQLKDTILASVDAVPAFADNTVSGGRLNIYRALAAVPAADGPAATSSTALFSQTAVKDSHEWLAKPDDLLA